MDLVTDYEPRAIYNNLFTYLLIYHLKKFSSCINGSSGEVVPVLTLPNTRCLFPLHFHTLSVEDGFHLDPVGLWVWTFLSK